MLLYLKDVLSVYFRIIILLKEKIKFVVLYFVYILLVSVIYKGFEFF